MSKKKYMLTYSFFCHCTSIEGTYNRQFRKTVPDSWSSAHRWKYYDLFVQTKRCMCSFSKTFALLINIWNHGKNLQDWRGQNHCKIFDWCNIWPLIVIFMDKICHFFFYFKDYYLRIRLIFKYKNMLTDYLSCNKLKDVRSCVLSTFLTDLVFTKFCIIFHFFWQI